MRTTLACVALTVASLHATTAAAQSFLYRPAAPSSGVSALVDARYQRVGDLGDGDLEAGQLGLALEGRILTDAHLELGASWGVRASLLALDGLSSRARVGLPPLAVFVGTGGTVDAFLVGVRLTTGASFALLDADDLSSNGDHAFAEIEVALATRCPDLALELRAAVGAAYAGSTALSGIVRIGAGADLGPATWPIRPYAGATLAYATDIAFGGELLLGAATIVEATVLRAGISLAPGPAPSGDVARLWLATNTGF